MLTPTRLIRTFSPALEPFWYLVEISCCLCIGFSFVVYVCARAVLSRSTLDVHAQAVTKTIMSLLHGVI